MLALIAGAGALPGVVARAQEQMPLVCALEGFAPDDLAADLTFRLETLGTLFAELTERGIREVCLCGAIRRPPVDPARIDAATLPLVETLRAAIAAGDDGALRAVIGLFETAGFQVRAAVELVPTLLPEAGVPTIGQPAEQAVTDAGRAAAVVKALSGVDVGQGCVVLRGQVLAIEGVFGTDWMLASLASRPDAGGGVLFKGAKAGQDRRADLPTIGPDTVSACAAVGLDGIVIEAGSALVLNLDAVVEACNRLGLYLWIRGATG